MLLVTEEFEEGELGDEDEYEDGDEDEEAPAGENT